MAEMDLTILIASPMKEMQCLVDMHCHQYLGTVELSAPRLCCRFVFDRDNRLSSVKLVITLKAV
jgi:hypothetical protein